MGVRIMKRRLGKFSIARKFIDDSPQLVQEIMSQCIILEAKYSPVHDTIEYLAICDQFQEVLEGHIPMVYIIKVSIDYDSRGYQRQYNWEFEVY